MKNVLIFLILVALVSLGEAGASSRNNGDADPDSDCCGAGWNVTRRKTFFGTTTRGVTNAVIPPTFGMTSGTSGCTQHPIAKKDEPAVTFAASNYDSIIIEMAAGRGEVLEAFGRLLSCSDLKTFARAMQQHYKAVVPLPAAPLQLFENVKQVIDSNDALAVGCNV